MIDTVILFLSTLLFSGITYITVTTKLTNYNIHTLRKKRKMRRANKKYCSVVHNTCICIQTLRREQSQRLRDTEICSSIIPCMRKIRHFCLTLNYPLSNVTTGLYKCSFKIQSKELLPEKLLFPQVMKLLSFHEEKGYVLI